MKLGALQPGYVPWLGFFDQMARVDLFLVYDEMQYTHYDWRNRNRIKGSQGEIWLVVPVKHQPGARICKVRIDNRKNWRRKHLNAMRMNYARAPFFKRYVPYFQELYSREWDKLVDLDMEIIRFCAAELGIKTPIVLASEQYLEDRFIQAGWSEDRRTERIIFFMKELGAEVLFEGESGKSYINEEMMDRAGCRVEYQQYHHPVYHQQFGPFIPYLSVVDLMFNHGDESLDILLGEKVVDFQEKGRSVR
ncbi:MAG: WbqC family protein [Deltaproteobacteria bacterium]|nr:WbqC family protein [Deltaproteobacteria bacterium]